MEKQQEGWKDAREEGGAKLSLPSCLLAPFALPDSYYPSTQLSRHYPSTLLPIALRL